MGRADCSALALWIMKKGSCSDKSYINKIIKNSSSEDHPPHFRCYLPTGIPLLNICGNAFHHVLTIFSKNHEKYRRFLLSHSLSIMSFMSVKFLRAV